MSDRRLNVTENGDGTFTLKGVAYECDRPNINGTVYPRAVMEKALAKYLETPADRRLLTIGCAAKPRLADAIGLVTHAELVGDEVRIEATTLKNNSAAVVAAGFPDQLAFAGAGIGKSDDETTIEEFEITSMGVVRLNEVQPCEHKNQTKKRYPHLAKCKDCGASICPDCDGSGLGSWGKCSTCQGKGTIQEESSHDH